MLLSQGKKNQFLLSHAITVLVNVYNMQEGSRVAYGLMHIYYLVSFFLVEHAHASWCHFSLGIYQAPMHHRCSRETDKMRKYK